MEAVAPTVGKAALAKILGWTRPKLDRRLESDARFPVVERGDQSGGWKFDPAAVNAHLGIAPAKTAKTPAAKAPVAVDQAQLRDTVAAPSPKPSAPPAPPKSRRSAHHEGEATARQRKDAADAALRENKLKLENGELVEKSQIRQDLADVFASLGNDLDGLPEAIATMLGVPDEMPRIRDLIDKARTRMVANAAPIMTDD